MQEADLPEVRVLAVGIAAVVKMKSSQHIVMQQPRHDLLDIL